jgi:hypothetical protein
MALLGAAIAYSSSTAASARGLLRRADLAAGSARAEHTAAPVPGTGTTPRRGATTWPETSFFNAPLFSLLLADETISTYAADCTTPKTTFQLGDTVCAKIMGAPLGVDHPVRRFSWVNSTGYVLQLTDVTTDPQTDTFTIPTTPTSPIAGEEVDNRGTWSIRSEDSSEISISAITYITVRDPDQPVTDLAVANLVRAGGAQVSAGTNVVFETYVTNNGPDTAQSVQLTTDVPADTSFAAVAQNAGPVFSCSTPGVGSGGTSTCTVASLPKGASAKLVFTYHVESGATPDTVLSSTANVASTTTDRHDADNTSTDTATVIAAPCAVSCPANITTNADPGAGGANVNYDPPTTSGDCGQTTVGDDGETVTPVSCSVESGSFFPVGTTTVTCAGPTGVSCSFLVTVENPGSLTISLNGASTLTYECGSAFTDPGATATNGAGDSVPVTATVSGGGSIGPGTPNGTYTITYTAVDGENSVSTTRTVNVVDTTAPTISINGANPLSVSCGTPFTDPGASADDGCAGQVPVSASGTVDTSTPGTYTITYTATDPSNHTANATRTVNVGSGDATPTITLNGADHMTIECGSTFTDPGASASVACGGAVPVQVSGTVNTHTPGNYTLTYTADNNGHTAQATRTVTVADTAAPTITLNGANPMTVECHSTFTDPGATANDGCAGSFPATASGTVDTHTPGTYTLTYTASDPSGNAATSITRTVNVVDTTAPVITVNGANPATVECHSTFTDPGATANDACAGSVSVTVSGSVDANTPGTYTLTYTATDGANPATATRTVNVVDTTAPIVTLNGASTVTVECHTSFNDPGATAADACDSSVAVTTSGTVDVNHAGSYTVTYSATDASHNTGTATRTVNVVDNTPPTITLNGANPMTVECHTVFNDPGATADDSCAGNLSAAIAVASNVNPNAVGSYTVTYTVSDGAGHTAQATRTVNVADTTAPTLTLLGANPLTVECHTAFTDPGATASDSCAGDLTAQIVKTGSVNANAVGSYTLTYTVSDGAGHTVSATRTVNVVDTTAPTITLNSQTPSLWPANHKYQTFQVTNFVTGASDSCDTSLGVSNVVIEKVTSDEAENGPGSGNTTNDIAIATDCKSVQLRAEREGGGDGRVYTITFKVTDASGRVGRATARVVVLHNPGEAVTDSGVHYTVNGSCP